MKSCCTLTLISIITLGTLNSQDIGFNTTIPNAPIHMVQPFGTTLLNQQPLLLSEYTGSNSADAIAVKGRCKPVDFYGIGGDFEGGFVGVQGRITGGLNQAYYGVKGDVAGTGNGDFYGMYGYAHSAGDNYAIYGNASGGTKNRTGYYINGNEYIQNKLGINNTNPAHPVHINQPTGTTISANFPVMHVEYTGSNQENVIAVRGRSVEPASNGTGGEFEGGAVGVVGKVTTSLSGTHFGVKGLVTSTSGTNVAIFGDASGLGGINYAGYFGTGNVYIDDKLGIGLDPVTNKLEVNGNASKSSAGSWLANSDERLKKNITPLDEHEMIEKLLALKGITYEWNDDKTGTIRPEGIQYGFTAQNIQKVFPSLVEEDAKGYLQTAYGTYDAMVVEAIRYLNEQVQMLTAELQALRKSENNPSVDRP